MATGMNIAAAAATVAVLAAGRHHWTDWEQGWSPWALWVGVGRQAQARQQKEQELQQM